jgi:hypothetical protein
MVIVMAASVDMGREAEARQRPGFWRRYGLAVYWLAFALYAGDAARYSGFVVHRPVAEYPWVGLVGTWVNLALEVALLRWLLRPLTFARSWGRLAAALGVYAVLGVLSAVTFATDLPGYCYVPGQFHMVTFVGLFVFTLATAAGSSRTESDAASARLPHNVR